MPRPIGPLAIDQHEYTPPFLVLPRLIAAVSGDFWGFRRIWFALNLAVIVAGLVIVAARFDRALGTYARWLTPFGRLAPAMVITLLMGNIQLAIIATSMLAMVLFERRRHTAGGALLAYAIVSELYPGLLLFYLLRLALRPVAVGRETLAWITILILATMRSPFLPTYAPFPSLWLATLLAALTWGRSTIFTTSVVAWGVLAFTFGTGGAPPVVNAIWTFTHTIAAFVLLAIAMRLAPAPLDSRAAKHWSPKAPAPRERRQPA